MNQRIFITQKESFLWDFLEEIQKACRIIIVKELKCLKNYAID